MCTSHPHTTISIVLLVILHTLSFAALAVHLVYTVDVSKIPEYLADFGFLSIVVLGACIVLITIPIATLSYYSIRHLRALKELTKTEEGERFFIESD